MKHYKLIGRLFCALAVPVAFAACEADDEGPATASLDFASIASSYYESSGSSTVTIPLRGANASEVSSADIEFGGTAVEGEDFTLAGITAEGVQISIVDDAIYEQNETIRVTLASSSLNLNGNNTHTITIVSDCPDIENPDASLFAGDYEAYERYGADSSDWYGPYTVHLIADPEHPNRLTFDNLYDSGCDAYMDFDFASGTVHFPDQEPCSVPLTASTGAYTLGDPCANEAVLIIDLDFDGGPWTYSFRQLN